MSDSLIARRVDEVCVELSRTKEDNERLREENAELREKLGSVNQKVKDLYGGMGSGSTIWRRSQYDKGYSNAITAALTAIDAAREGTE